MSLAAVFFHIFLLIMSFHSFKLAPTPFESPSFESLFSPTIRETLLSSRPHNANAIRASAPQENTLGDKYRRSVTTSSKTGSSFAPLAPTSQRCTALPTPLLHARGALPCDASDRLSSGFGSGSSVFGSSSGFLNFRGHAPPTSSKPVFGSLEDDLAREKFTNRWDTWEDFTAWLKSEQEEQTIELRLSKTVTGGMSSAFKSTFYYLCSRHGTGGVKTYQKKHPEWERKVPNKRLDCSGSLRVKTYPGSRAVLGFYHAVHNHKTGNANLPYVRISAETREFIAGLLRLGVEPSHIVSGLTFSRKTVSVLTPYV